MFWGWKYQILDSLVVSQYFLVFLYHHLKIFTILSKYLSDFNFSIPSPDTLQDKHPLFILTVFQICNKVLSFGGTILERTNVYRKYDRLSRK